MRIIRGQRVLLDSDLAKVYGVPTARLNQQVRRYDDRFQADFALQLTTAKFDGLMLQIATSKKGRGGAVLALQTSGFFGWPIPRPEKNKNGSSLFSLEWRVDMWSRPEA